MMELANVWAVARAEMRLTRRLVRYWVFLVIAYLVALAGYFYYGAIHAFFSSYSATAASIGPRFLIGAFGFYYLAVFVVGLVFLAFDVRSRDRRERMVEVLDSRPMTNLELLTGRFLGLLLPAWVPVVVLALLLQGLGSLLPLLGSPVGEHLEWVSLFTFSVVNAVPAFSVALALVFFVTLLVRNRLIAAVVVLVILGADLWAVLRLPLMWNPLFDILGAYVVNFPSEILPGVADWVGWLQRLAVLLEAAGLLVLASVIHPRLDGGRRGRAAAAGAGFLALAMVLVGAGVLERRDNIEVQKRWMAAHEARAEEPVPDLVSQVGVMHIEPGRDLRLELDMTFRAGPEDTLSTALFTLNPGEEVVSVAAPGGGPLEFTHHSGLLEIRLPRPLAPGEEATVHVVAEGVPDRWFGYLDSAKVLEALTAYEGAIFLLGFERSIYDRRFVALMPGVRWLPASGTEKNRDDPRLRRPDLFDVDLTVTVPAGWLAAGPGRRQEVSADADTVTYRFAPGAPVPEAALIASRFTSRSAVIEGVTTEVLLHPSHQVNLERLADAAGEIRGWVGDRLREAAEVGLPYPYDGLTLVEVPNALRGIGGGWRMDTALAPPAMLLVREASFPTVRFDVPFRKPEEFQDREGGLPRAKRERLQMYFVNDFSGGNVFVGAAKNFFLYQTRAVGPEGLALDFVAETLTTELVTDTRGYFSAHMFSPELNQQINAALGNYFINRRSGRTVADAVIEAFTSRPEVWDAALQVSLVDMDPWEEPARTVDVLTLKGGSTASSLLDALGREKAGALLADLLAGHRGGVYAMADVIAAGEGVGVDLQALLGDWLGSTDMAGFVGQEARAYRLPDSEDGAARYQLVVSVRNDEEAPGLFKIVYVVGTGEESERLESEPIPLPGRSAVRFGAVTSRAPRNAYIDPYLALNRGAFMVPFEAVDEEKIVREAAVEGVEAIDWAPPRSNAVVVDDLDEGFDILEEDGGRSVRLGARESDDEATDQGLPTQLFGSPPSRWSRMVSNDCWGQYRHTMAAVRAGSGRRSAEFTAVLPDPGSWDLEIHMPSKRRFFAVRSWGPWNLTITDDGGSREATFDSNAGEQGWNLVGTFDLAGGEVRLRLSDKTTGQVVVADAIRWSPSAGAQIAVEAQ